MYLFYMMTNGYIPMGTDGMKEIKTNTVRGVNKAAREFLDNRAGAIYFIESWTQEMTDCTPPRFEEYIRTHGIKVAHS